MRTGTSAVTVRVSTHRLRSSAALAMILRGVTNSSRDRPSNGSAGGLL